MISLTVVIVTFAVVFTGIWLIFRMSGTSELRKQPYKKVPPSHTAPKAKPR